MFLLYLFTCHSLPSAALAQQPQAQSGQPIFTVNAKYVQGVGPGYWPTAGSGLTLNLAAGSAVCDTGAVSYAGGTLTMAASATNYVYLDPSASCAPASNATGFADGQIVIATVATGASTITAITDLRTWFAGGKSLLPNVVAATRFPGADIGAKINAAIASAQCPSTGCVVVLEGSYSYSTQIVINSKTVTLISFGGGYDQNAGQHAAVRLTWTGGTGPAILVSGTAATGSRLAGFEMNNTSSTLVGFISVEAGAGGVILQDIFIDRPTTQALSYGIQVGSVANGAVNYTVLKDLQVIKAAPIGLYIANALAGTYLFGGYYVLNGVVGTVNTSGTAVTWVSGQQFPTDGSWTNTLIAIGTALFTVSTVNSSTTLTLTASAGTQTGVNYARGAQLQLGSTGQGSQDFAAFGTTFNTVSPSALGTGLPLIEAVVTRDSTNFHGCHFEFGANSGLTGYVLDTNGTNQQGQFNFFGGEANATIGTGAAGVFHLNEPASSLNVQGMNIGENPLGFANPSKLVINDSSAAVAAIRNSFQISETMTVAGGTLAMTNVLDLVNTNGGVLLATASIPQKLSFNGGSTISKVLLASGTLTYTAIAAETCQEQTLPVTGAATTGTASASPAASLGSSNLAWSAWVSAANTVSVRVCNVTTGSLTPLAVTWNVEVMQ
jgi:hypothetical protein